MHILELPVVERVTQLCNVYIHIQKKCVPFFDDIDSHGASSTFFFASTLYCYSPPLSRASVFFEIFTFYAKGFSSYF